MVLPYKLSHILLYDTPLCHSAPQDLTCSSAAPPALHLDLSTSDNCFLRSKEADDRTTLYETEQLRRLLPKQQEMSKGGMYTLGRPFSTRSRSWSILTVFLFILCVPVFLYQLVPAFTQSTDTLIDKIVAHFWETPCSPDIGDGQCCALFVKATPCVEECRKRFVDRERFTLTLEYEECADTCLRDWEGCNGVSRDHTT